MSLCKELLLSCVVMMHLSFVASRPTDPPALCVNSKVLSISLGNLETAEKDYVKHMFHGVAPEANKTPDGITWPAGKTTEEIQTSICAITDYLDNHMPAIISSLTTEKTYLIKNISAFNTQFKREVRKVQNTGTTEKCHRNITALNDYEKKKLGYQIIFFAKKWVQNFANNPCVPPQGKRDLTTQPLTMQTD